MIDDLVIRQIQRDLCSLEMSDSLRDLASSRVLITGANGMLGTYFTLALSLAQAKMGKTSNTIAVSRNSVPRFASLSLEILKPRDAASRILDGGVDVVIHAASPAHANYFMQDPVACFSVNVDWAQILAQACLNSGAQFVYISSGEVYGIDPPIPTSESEFSGLDPVNPRNIYALSKIAGEAVLSSMVSRMNLDLRICRFFHTFGPGIRPDEPRLFGALVNAAIDERDCILMGNPSATRSFLYSFDALDGIAHVLDKCRVGAAVNIAANEAHSVREIATRSMDAMTNGKYGVRFVSASTSFAQAASEIYRNEADNSLLRSTGWAPQVNLEEGFVRTLNSLRPE